MNTKDVYALAHIHGEALLCFEESLTLFNILLYLIAKEAQINICYE